MFILKKISLFYLNINIFISLDTFDASCFSWRKNIVDHLESNTETKKSGGAWKCEGEHLRGARDTVQRERRACNFNYDYQRVSLIAGSPTRSPHVITLWFDFFPRGITNGYRRGRARCWTAFLFVSLVATFCAAPGPREEEGRIRDAVMKRRRRRTRDNRLLPPCLPYNRVATHQSRLSATDNK